MVTSARRATSPIFMIAATLDSGPRSRLYPATMTDTTNTPPILCNMTGAPDTPAERVETYAALFADALVDRERTTDGIRFRFRADPGIEDRVRELARREQACCAFFSFTITADEHEVRWDATVPDDDL